MSESDDQSAYMYPHRSRKRQQQLSLARMVKLSRWRAMRDVQAAHCASLQIVVYFSKTSESVSQSPTLNQQEQRRAAGEG